MYIVVTITLIWFSIFLIDNLLEHRLGFRYISWKFQKDLLLKPFYIRWHTSKIGIKTFHDYNFKLKSKKYIHWFNCGIIAYIFICIYGYTLFIPPIFQLLTDYKSLVSNDLESKERFLSRQTFAVKNYPNKETDFTLQIGIPGYNIPWSHAILVAVTLLIAAAFHEFGHALSAANETVTINGAGVFLAYLFPGAFVNISNIELSNTDLMPKMRILCAGVWHNLCLCVAMVTLIKYLLPICIYFGYYRGICVIDVPKVLMGGLVPGDKITRINKCFTSDIQNEFQSELFPPQNSGIKSFYNCLLADEFADYGHCIQSKNVSIAYNNALLLKNKDKSKFSTSQPSSKSALNNGSFSTCNICEHDEHVLCYSEIDSKLSLQIQNSQFEISNIEDVESLRICLNVREALIADTCNNNRSCEPDEKCLKLVHPRNQNIIAISIDNGAHDKLTAASRPILYYGSINTFLQELHLTSYCSRIPVLLPTFLPSLLILLLKYLFSVSGGLMILNSMPFYGLDGYLILEHILESMYGINEKFRKMALVGITGFTTFVIVVNILLSLVNI